MTYLANPQHPFKGAAQKVLARLRELNPDAKLALAYDLLALAHGYPSWHVMKPKHPAFDHDEMDATAESQLSADDPESALDYKKERQRIRIAMEQSKKRHWQDMLNTVAMKKDDFAPHIVLCEDIRSKIPGNPMGDVVYWQNRAFIMLEAVLKVLMWQNNNVLHIEQIKQAITIEGVASLAINSGSVPPDIKDGLLNYVNGLAAFPREIIGDSSYTDKAPNLPNQCGMQHGFLTQQIAPALGFYRHDGVLDFSLPPGEFDLPGDTGE